jgi:hypothetical protein
VPRPLPQSGVRGINGSGGRQLGTPNKTTALLKDAILQAAAQAGGGDLVAYLKQQAIENPGPFLALLGKVLPIQVQDEEGRHVSFTHIECVVVNVTGDRRELKDVTDRSARGLRTVTESLPV